MRRALLPALALVAVSTTGCKRVKRTIITYDTGYVDPDADGDGFESIAAGGDDCDDDDPNTYPGAPEVCDGKNNDCDAAIDEDAVDGVQWFRDGDEDGYGNPDSIVTACTKPPGYMDNGDDCDDDEPSAYPGAEEICNDGIDQNCNDDDWECVRMGSVSLGDAEARLLGSSGGDRVGTSASGVGDVDGDGFADLVVGGPKHDARGAESGAAWLVRGPVAGDIVLEDSATATFLGIQEGVEVGTAVAAAGDVNGDGYADILLGAMRGKAGGNDAGEAYVIHGPVTGTVAMFDADLRLLGEYSYDVAGGAVTSIGDLTGDGYDDVLVGATGYGDGGFQSRGAVYIASGAISGTVDLSNAPARVFGSERYDRVGSAVAGPVDVDGDGVNDLVYGGRSAPANRGDGAVFVTLGPVSGNVSAGDAAIRLEGAAEGSYAGSSLSLGDLNGDGHLDLVVGAPGWTDSAISQGAVHVVNGPLEQSGTLADADATYTGRSEEDEAGTSVSATGDLNDDGNDDLVVGVPGADGAGTDSGAAYLFYGPVSGSDLLVAADVSVSALTAGGAVGSSVAIAPDVNGDDLDEVLIGAPMSDVGATDAGAVYVLLGTRW